MTADKDNAEIERVRRIVGWYTLAAVGTGAVPIPASSAAIVANNGFMIAHVAAAMKQPVTWGKVIASLGIAGTLNIGGRAVFIEVGKALGWGTASLWALAALSAAGAATAGAQTYVVGLIAMEIAKNGGDALPTNDTGAVIDDAKESYSAFVAEMKAKDLTDPGSPPEDERHSDPQRPVPRG